MAAPYIGTVINGSIAGTFTSGSSAGTINIVTTGTYLFAWSFAVNNVISSGGGQMTGANLPAAAGNYFPATNLGATTFYVVGSMIISQATGTYTFSISANIGGTLNTGVNFGFFNAVRIG